MSPNSETNGDNSMAQAQPTHNQKRATSVPAVVVPPHAHERIEEASAIGRILKMLGVMDERMQRMEPTQMSAYAERYKAGCLRLYSA